MKVQKYHKTDNSSSTFGAMGERNHWESLRRNLYSEVTAIPAVLRDLSILQRVWFCWWWISNNPTVLGQCKQFAVDVRRLFSLLFSFIALSCQQLICMVSLELCGYLLVWMTSQPYMQVSVT